jgi:hypothetical protein
MHEMAVSHTRELLGRDAQLARLLAIKESTIPIRFQNLSSLPRQYGSSNNDSAWRERMLWAVPPGVATAESIIVDDNPTTTTTTTMTTTTTTTATLTSGIASVTGQTQEAAAHVASSSSSSSSSSSRRQPPQRRYMFGALFTFDDDQGPYGNSHRAAAARFVFNGMGRSGAGGVD